MAAVIDTDTIGNGYFLMQSNCLFGGKDDGGFIPKYKCESTECE